MTSHDDRSPDRIEQEVEEARARIAADLDEIRARFSPGSMLDQALDYARASGGAEFSRNLGRQVRDNPLPIALIGAGIGWLMTAGRTGPATHDDAFSARRMARGYGDGGVATRDAARRGIGETIASAVGSVRDAAASVTGAAGSAVHAAGHAASSAAHTVGSAASNAAHAAGSAAHSVGDAASSAAGSARDMGRRAGDGLHAGAASARGYGSDAVDAAGRMMPRDIEGRVARAVEEQPLILGAVGLALGALAGAMLPGTRMENRTFGGASDRMRDQAGAMARDGYESARSAAGDVVEEAKASVGDAADQAREAARHLDRAGLDRPSGPSGDRGDADAKSTAASAANGRGPRPDEPADRRPAAR